MKDKRPFYGGDIAADKNARKIGPYTVALVPPGPNNFKMYVVCDDSGRCVWDGDGTLAMFDRKSDAIQCAKELFANQ